MKLTPDQRKIGMKYAIMSLLFIDIHNKRYDELQQIYETLNLKNNDRLVQKLDEERTIIEVFTRSIYMDAILVIADCIDDTPEIIELAVYYILKDVHILRRLLQTGKSNMQLLEL